MKFFFFASLLFLAGITAQTQPQWTAIMTQGSKGQSFNDFATFAELDTFIREQANKSRVINEVVYAGERWYGVATESSVATDIVWKTETSFPQDWIKKQWDQNKYITKVTFGGGVWLAIMTNQTPYKSQTWARRDTWEEVIAFAQEKWKENTKFNITDIAYGQGKWHVVMSLLSSYEAQSFNQSEEFPYDWLNEKYKDHFNVTSVEHDGEKWHFVLSKYASPLGEIAFSPESRFPKEEIKRQWDNNRRITSFAFARDPYDVDEINFEELAQQGRSFKDDEGGSNLAKAADRLAANDYPEAIRLYKLAISDGNTQETTYNNLAWAQYLNGNCTEALDNATKSISVKSTSFNNHTKGAILKCQNKCSEAIRYFDEAIRLYRKENEKFSTTEYYTDRAAAKRCLGSYASAIEDIELALTIQPGDSGLKATLKELNTLAGNR
jgi:tetratricopeptide (TPR) repeat protein